MKVGFVWDGNYPWDVRVEKICKSLVAEGHEVHMVCRNTKQQPRNEVIDGINIHRLPCIKHSGPFNYLINFPLFFNPIWYLNIESVLRNENIELVIVRDITLSLTTLFVTKNKNIPVILDMAEPYPEMIRTQHKYENLGWIKKLVRNVKLAEWVETKTLNKVDSVLAMVEESKRRIVEMGIPENKVCTVSNTPTMNKSLKGKDKIKFPGSMEKLRSKTVFIYVGFINMHRGLQTAIKGLQHILSTDKNVVLLIIGSGDAEEDLKRLTKRLNLEDSIVFEGYQHHSHIRDYISSADIGIITHLSCGLWDNTIPNKLFDYMYMQKPVLSSDAKPAKRIIEEERCGLVYHNNDPVEFAENAIALLDPAVREKMGRNGLNAVKEKYNWGIDSGKLIENINKLSS